MTTSTKFFYTLVNSLTHEIPKIKGSKFIAYASPIYTKFDVRQMLDKAKADLPSASHHCYAYRLHDPTHTSEIPLEYQSDDGEPYGTAGKPILRQLIANDLVNACIIVSRIYGGVELGRGGLIRAYGSTAAEVLKLVDKQEKVLSKAIWIRLPYQYQGMIKGLLRHSSATIIRNVYLAQHVQILMEVPLDNFQNFSSQLKERGNGKILILDDLS